MKWFFKCFKQYFDFNGRARRKEYWFFALFNCIISIVLMCLWMVPMIAMAISAAHNGIKIDEWDLVQNILSNPALYIWILYYLAALIPSIAVTVRRLHDIGRSGFWAFLICGVPILSSITNYLNLPAIVELIFFPIMLGVCILSLVWMCTDSQWGENQWGPNPKGYPTLDGMPRNDLI